MNATQTIVIVDDEEIVRDVACAILKGRGYHVVAVESGERALALMRKRGDEICAMVVDPITGGLNPQHLVSSLMALNPDLAIIISSGSRPEHALREFDPKCISGFVQKPYTAARLRDGVALALDSCRLAA